jgi:Flp pilus assembly protein TadG
MGSVILFLRNEAGAVAVARGRASLSVTVMNVARLFRRNEAGAVAVEVTVAIPFLVFLTAGIVEYGRMIYTTQLLQTGVRDAARYLASLPGLPGASSALRDAAEARARRLAATGSITGGPLRVAGWSADAAGIGIAYEPVANPRDAVTGLRAFRGDDTVYVVRVTGSMSYTGIGLLQALRIGPVAVNAVHEERHVAP